MYDSVGPLDHVKRSSVIDTGYWAAVDEKRSCRCALNGLTVAYYEQVMGWFAPVQQHRIVDNALPTSVG